MQSVQILTVFVLCASETFASVYRYEKAKCIKDLLLIVDCSFSINSESPTTFRNLVKPFLKNLIREPSLNVGRDGTNIAMIVCSSRQKNRILFNFGNDITQDQIINEIDEKLLWTDVQDGHTETGLAFNIAKEEIFPRPNPLNHRPDVDDVIVIVTNAKQDGARRGSTESAIVNAKELKNRGILLVAAAVGKYSSNVGNFLRTITTSEQYIVEATFDNMNDILSTLVAYSCTKPGIFTTGRCHCPHTIVAPTYLRPGETKASVYWPKPTYSCSTGVRAEERSHSVQPNVRSGDRFFMGKYTVTYTFKLNGDMEVKCAVIIEVKGELCRGIAYSSSSQVCCCGTIHEKQADHGCCGPDYFATYNHKCCPNANLVQKQETCPEL